MSHDSNYSRQNPWKGMSTRKRLQHTIIHCNTRLQHTATHCNTLQTHTRHNPRIGHANEAKTTKCCDTLHNRIATNCNTLHTRTRQNLWKRMPTIKRLQRTATHCNTTLQHTATHTRQHPWKGHADEEKTATVCKQLLHTASNNCNRLKGYAHN